MKQVEEPTSICVPALWPQSPPPSCLVYIQDPNVLFPPDPVRPLPRICPEDAIRKKPTASLPQGVLCSVAYLGRDFNVQHRDRVNQLSVSGREHYLAIEWELWILESHLGL